MTVYTKMRRTGLPLWLKRSLFVAVVIVAGFLEGLFLFPMGFDVMAGALVITGSWQLVGYKRIGTDKMARYLCRNCPRCNEYIGIVLREAGRGGFVAGDCRFNEWRF